MTDREVLMLLDRIDYGLKPKEKEMRGLSQIRKLSLSNIEELPNSISVLTGIKSIEIYSSQIKDISALSELKTLTNLSIKDTQISDISVLSKLQSLEYLCLIDTNVKDISALSELTALKRLNLSINKVSDITALSKLSFLTSLSLVNTCVNDITELMGLTALTYLNLSRSLVGKLPESITNLKNLQYLDLSHTLISTLPENIGNLPNLKQLILNGNNLTELPESILALNLEYKDSILRNADKYIGTLGMQLKSQPISLFYQPHKTIEDYYAESKKVINECKVIFLGSEGVGKTYIIKRILNDNHKINETLKETVGVSITYKDYDIEKESYRINFWDFGGQEIMLSMYRCFLTNRTGYVVVLSSRFGDLNRQARYWLRVIESFANNVPVILFVNYWASGVLNVLDKYSLCRDYPNIKSIIFCSAKSGEDAEFSALENSIKDMVLGNDRIGAKLPERWERVKHIITGMSKHLYYIDQQKYRDICDENGINDENLQQWLLDLFHDLGECLRFKFDDENDRINDLIILEPEWLINALCTFFRECSHFVKYGFVALEGIRLLLNHPQEGFLRNICYTSYECDYILKIMGKYKLVYRVPERDIVFVPSLLRDSAPPDLEYSAYSIIYEMRYKFLPESVIYGLMIEMYPYLDYERCWRKGAVIDFRRIFNLGLLAVVEMSDEYDGLRIKVYSFSNHPAWELLQEIRACLLDINNEMNIEASDYVVIESQGTFEAISIDRLLKLKARGNVFYCGVEQDYKIVDLLEMALGPEQVRDLNKYFETANTNLSIRGKNLSYEYDLLAMKEALSPPESRLLSSLDNSIISCDIVCKHIITACMQIQSNPIYWNGHENSCSKQLRDILLSTGMLIREQTRYGNAKEIGNPGDLDFLVMSNKYDPLTIIETVTIDSVNTEYIYHHLKKLLDDYNPTGLRELFLMIFVKKGKKQFRPFWTQYYHCIEGMDVDDFHCLSIEERHTESLFIKHALVQYDIAGIRFLVHHICTRASD